MDETYRMLAKAHHDDLDREAARRALAAKLPNRAGIVPRALTPLARVRRTRTTPTPTKRPASAAE